ncbi:MAG: helix-turn-helix transcriptional regulator [Candidatus Pseudobacter hemicellulosilyticus]|uniref:Helix-turn-helix transcriptional regulator n=1 Tax=Candidatus Pseudobacter hemicellulosilyticus TaxID=3121375 RepID=A0AAJ6BK08_9BACT|nr:MAG: helix-turn-helix transcriptional regulator [Pseudobacter sp.]
MAKRETMRDFTQRLTFPCQDIYSKHTNERVSTGQFNVYRRGEFGCRAASPYNRRDFYKISLIIGKGKLYYANKGIVIDRNALLFSNPSIPYSWEPTSDKQEGFFCLFTQDFINPVLRSETLHESPLFRIGGDPVFFVAPEQERTLSELFLKMLTELESEYIHKYDLLRNYVSLLLHEAQRSQPANTYFQHTNASTRIASLFMELLERQFPIDSRDHVLRLRTASDFASHLSVHANHLNRAVKEITGRTTTEHIAERITSEAKALLTNTSWNVSEIAYTLGFEYPAYFNNFFKKQTSQTPGAFRQ